MANSLPNGTPRMHAKTLRSEALAGIRAGDANVRIRANSIEKPKQSRQQVREAMRRVGLTSKAFCINADISESVFSDALADRRALDAEWIRAQEPPFRRALREVEDEAAGVDPTSQRQESFNDIVELLRRMWFRHERRAVNE